MEQTVHSPIVYDHQQCRQVWQRVMPGMEAYPGMEEIAPPRQAQTGAAAAQPSAGGMAPAQVRAEEQLPGAQADPCCMGSAASEMLAVIEGFIEEELADRRYYLAFARQSPTWARQRLRDMAADEGAHAKRLMAVYYLITGQCYRPAVSCERIYVGRLCAALRERYHAEACGGMNYARAADGTTDPCLVKLLNELSDDEYRHANQLMALLERALQG